MAFSLELHNKTPPKASKLPGSSDTNFATRDLFLFGFVFKPLFLLPLMLLLQMNEKQSETTPRSHRLLPSALLLLCTLSTDQTHAGRRQKVLCPLPQPMLMRCNVSSSLDDVWTTSTEENAVVEDSTPCRKVEGKLWHLEEKSILYPGKQAQV